MQWFENEMFLLRQIDSFEPFLEQYYLTVFDQLVDK